MTKREAEAEWTALGRLYDDAVARGSAREAAALHRCREVLVADFKRAERLGLVAEEAAK